MNCVFCGGWGYTKTQPVRNGWTGHAIFASLPVATVPKDEMMLQYPVEVIPRAAGVKMCKRCVGTGIEPLVPV